MKNLWMPIVTTISVSIITGLCTYNTTVGFLGGFGLSLVLHFVIGGLFNTYMQYKSNKEFEQITNDRIAEINKQSLKLTCPCDRGIEQSVSLFFNRHNNYTCAVCEKLINCNVSVKTTLPTQIIDLEAAQLDIENKLQQKAIKSNTDE